MNFRFPIFLDLTGKKCLVTGAGYELAGKVQSLVDAGADVTYVNPEAESAIRILAAAGLIRWRERVFEPEDLAGCFLVITDLEDNSQVFRLAEQQRVLCNAVDDPEHCRFSFGALHRQGDLTIAISTNGWGPALAVRLKQRLQADIGPEYGELLALFKSLRGEITASIPDFGKRRDLWYRLVDGELLGALREGRREEALRMARLLIEEAASSTWRSGISGDSGDR